MSLPGASLKTCLIFLLLTIDDVVNLSTSSHRHSGIYVDSGQDQMMIQTLTTKEKRALEHQILKLLGVPEKPKFTRGTDRLMKRSAARFLLNIYENRLGEDSQLKKKTVEGLTESYLTQQELNAIDQSDVIIAFTPEQKHGGKLDRVKRMWFNVTSVPAEEQMTSAELRLYRGPYASNKKNRGAFTMTVYRVARAKNGEREMHFVDSVHSAAAQQGWITFNITESLHHWMTNPHDNKGLYLSVQRVDGTLRETRPENMGIVGINGDDERQPFMAGFFKSSGLKQARASQMTLNSPDLQSTRRRRRGSGSKVVMNSTPFCKRSSLYVSFKDLQWEDWIIAPEGYDAYVCKGECNIPFTKQMNATNHAIIQNIVHLLQPQEVPKPCCTPTQLSDMSVLHFIDDNNTVLKKFKDMVVRGCGCH